MNPMIHRDFKGINHWVVILRGLLMLIGDSSILLKLYNLQLTGTYIRIFSQQPVEWDGKTVFFMAQVTNARVLNHELVTVARRCLRYFFRMAEAKSSKPGCFLQ
jgi:hypothetical protein